MKKIFMVAVISSLLVGCKVDFSTKVNTDDLLSEDVKVMKGEINFEVSSCSDYEDSRLESKSLIDIKNKIPTVFNNAEYKGCFSKRMDSYATFSVPVSVGMIKSENQKISTDFMVYSNNSSLMSIAITNEARNKIKKAEKDIMGSLDFNISLTLSKGKQSFPVGLLVGNYVTTSKLKNEPVAVMDFDINKLKEVNIKLSNVATDYLMKYGSYSVIIRNNP